MQSSERTILCGWFASSGATTLDVADAFHHHLADGCALLCMLFILLCIMRACALARVWRCAGGGSSRLLLLTDTSSALGGDEQVDGGSQERGDAGGPVDEATQALSIPAAQLVIIQEDLAHCIRCVFVSPPYSFVVSSP
jgi:hypothetical protein